MFIDRQPTQPNRYKVIPEDGTKHYYVRLERADNPTVEGTRLNSETLNALLRKPIGAAVGQYLRVAKVDESGRAEAVEGVDLGTWTGGSY